MSTHDMLIEKGKEKILKNIIQHSPEKSSAQIAEMADVSVALVKKVKNSIIQNNLKSQNNKSWNSYMS